ncbi:MAG TPA: nucleotide-binding protein [Solirubrobacterales bacterium]|nr:nucleotide-binding protein [Solirubrobacterales bacterium]
MVLNGEHWNPREVKVLIFETSNKVDSSQGPVDTWKLVSAEGDPRTDDLITRPAGELTEDTGVTYATDRRAVMVVYGRNTSIRDAMFAFLRAIDLRPLEWTALVGAANTGAPYIGEVLDQAFATCQAVVVISTPDDVAYLRTDLVPQGDPENELSPRGQARPNVFFEAGMAIGRFPHRTVFTEIGSLRAASDLAGRHAIRLGPGPECRRDLAHRLEEAGCQIDITGTDWLSAGEFSPPRDISAEQPPTVPSQQGNLLRRIDALLNDLDGDAFATWTSAQVFNELITEAGIDGVPLAEQRANNPRRATMDEHEMRLLLNQLKARL